MLTGPRKGDINNIKFRRALIDTFINKIYVFEDKLHIFCNAQESKIEVSISDSKCSPMERVVERWGFEPQKLFCSLHDFQSCSFGLSDTSPNKNLPIFSLKRQYFQN